MRTKRLTKSNNKMVCGVCAGIAEYFGIDTSFVRLVYVLLLMCSGIGLRPYIIAAIVMDEAPAYGNSYRGYIEYKSSAPVTFENESGEPVGFKLGSDTEEIKGFTL